MDKKNFEDLPSENTPVKASELNDMQDGIEKSVNYIGSTQPITGEKVWLKTGKNLFNKNNVINGYRFGSDGSLYADSDFSATDFIEVNSSTQYTVSWVIQIVQCVCYYDENKNFISRNGSEATFTTPSNCKYIRASVTTENINSAQIELGSTATTYEPYIDKEILVKNNSGAFEKFYSQKDIAAKVEKTIEITSTGQDLNNYKTEGRYYFPVAATNMPAGVNGILEVYLTPIGMVKQVWYRHGTANVNDYETYVRTFTSNTWSSWKSYAIEEKIDTKLNSKADRYQNGWTNQISLDIVSGEIALILIDADLVLVASKGGSSPTSGYAVKTIYTNNSKTYTFSTGTNHIDITLSTNAIIKVIK